MCLRHYLSFFIIQPPELIPVGAGFLYQGMRVAQWERPGARRLDLALQSRVIFDPHCPLWAPMFVGLDLTRGPQAPGWTVAGHCGRWMWPDPLVTLAATRPQMSDAVSCWETQGWASFHALVSLVLWVSLVRPQSPSFSFPDGMSFPSSGVLHESQLLWVWEYFI